MMQGCLIITSYLLLVFYMLNDKFDEDDPNLGLEYKLVTVVRKRMF